MAFAAARMIAKDAKGNRKKSIDVTGNQGGRKNSKNRLQFNKKTKPCHARQNVNSVKIRKIKGKNGVKEQIDLIVNIDLVEWSLSKELVSELKEVFMLFDKDEDGVLTFPELAIVMKSLGQRPTEVELLRMVREVSEDDMYDTIEFNEFLQMISKQQKIPTSTNQLVEAFRIFDKDDDGLISVEELRKIMTDLGEGMTKKEVEEMVKEADTDGDGLINYQEFCKVLCNDNPKKKKKKKKRKQKDQEESEKDAKTIESESGDFSAVNNEK